MKFKVGDLVRVCWRGASSGGWIDGMPDGMVGMVISRRRHSLGAPPLYGVYLTNLECRKIVEKDLQKL